MPLGRRRPLLRAAAVGGGAYMAGKRRAQAQQAQAAPAYDAEPAYAAPPQPPPPPAPAPSGGGLTQEAMEQLKSLAQLHDQGILTDQEFEEQKARVLAG